MKISKLTVVCSVLVAALATAAHAEEITGVVRGAGGGPLGKIYLEGGSDGAGPTLCSGDVTKRIRRLGAMTVKVTGEWKTKKDGARDCLEPSSFVVLKVGGGREAYVGTLSQTNGAYRFEGEDGKTLPLAQVTSGLKKLEGRKVILDLKATESPTAKEATYSVVSYSEFPQ